MIIAFQHSGSSVISGIILAVLGLSQAATFAQTTKPQASPSHDFLQVLGPRDWAFPKDHGRHDGFKTEWWYFSGNLHDRAGRRFGYQLTFFRVATTPPKTAASSAWALGDLYFAHAAISDIQENRFLFKDRMQRARAGLAESSDQTLNVYLRDWRSILNEEGTTALLAKDEGFGIDLTAGAGVGPVLEGPGGVNAKGTHRGQASYYYSEPQMPTHGTLTIGSQQFIVDGLTWMDHEFSSNALGENQIGWDWIALSFPDRSSLMVYRLRNRTGATDYLSGTLIPPSGKPKYLSAADIKMEPAQPWRSPDTSAQYPQRWRLSIANHAPINLQTLMTGQELITPNTTGVNYFEGAVQATDDAGEKMGEGYLEMTGYADQSRTFMGNFLTFVHFAKALWLTP